MESTKAVNISNLINTGSVGLIGVLIPAIMAKPLIKTRNNFHEIISIVYIFVNNNITHGCKVKFQYVTHVIHVAPSFFIRNPIELVNILIDTIYDIVRQSLPLGLVFLG